MSENTRSREEIEKLHLDGWKFRIKTIKGKQYLSARKDGEEKGLGTFTPDLQEIIKVLDQSKKTPLATVADQTSEVLTKYTVTLYPTIQEPMPIEIELSRSEIETALFDIKFERARVKAIDCEHAWNGHCSFWPFMKDSNRLSTIFEQFGAEDYKLGILVHNSQGGEEQSRQDLRVTDLLCFDCERYTPRKKKLRHPQHIR